VKWAGHVTHIEKMNSTVVYSEGKRPFRISRRRRENTIKMNFKEIGLEDVHLVCLNQDRDQWLAVVSAVMNPHIS
jgi:hypothetical protein